MCDLANFFGIECLPRVSLEECGDANAAFHSGEVDKSVAQIALVPVGRVEGSVKGRVSISIAVYTDGEERKTCVRWNG